jgi:hypothetical protein
VRTAPIATDPEKIVTITHPFHPERGKRFTLLERRNCWGQWRVCYLAQDDVVGIVPESWTDVGAKDPFVEQARGRAIARTVDLLEVARMAATTVKPNTPLV